MFDLVGDALPARLGAGPQFQVLGSVIKSVAIEVMHRLRGAQRTLQDLSHDEPMLELIRPAFGEIPKFGRNWHLEVAVVHIAIARDLLDRFVCLDVAVHAFARCMRLAELTFDRWQLSMRQTVLTRRPIGRSARTSPSQLLLDSNGLWTTRRSVQN